jgi:hypothetical protein
MNATKTFAVSVAASHTILERHAMSKRDIKKWLNVFTAMKKLANIRTMQREKMSVRHLLVLH